MGANPGDKSVCATSFIEGKGLRRARVLKIGQKKQGKHYENRKENERNRGKAGNGSAERLSHSHTVPPSVAA